MLYAKWFSIPLTTRAEIARRFGIAKTGFTHVQDNRVVSDGYKFEEVERTLNLKALKAFVGVDDTDDLGVLFDLVVAKIEGRVVEVPPAADLVLPPVVIAEEIKEPALQPVEKPTEKPIEKPKRKLRAEKK